MSQPAGGDQKYKIVIVTCTTSNEPDALPGEEIENSLKSMKTSSETLANSAKKETGNSLSAIENSLSCTQTTSETPANSREKEKENSPKKNSEYVEPKKHLQKHVFAQFCNDFGRFSNKNIRFL